MRAVVYLRRPAPHRRSATNFDQLYPLLDLVTSLDPHFTVAYRFGCDLPGRGVSRAAPAGPIWRCTAAARASTHDSRALGVPAGHRLRLLLVGARLRASRRVVREGRRAFPARRRGWRRWPPPRWPRAATGSRRASCGRELRDNDRCRLDPAQRRASAAAARRDGQHRRAQSQHRSDFAKRHGRPPASWRELARRPTLARHSGRSDRRAVCARSRDRARQSRAPTPGCGRCRTAPQPRTPVSQPNDRRIRCSSLPALFGACIGSFLNVVIYRLPLGQSLVSPPSRCPQCGYRLHWYDNIPVLSWLLLRRPLPQVRQRRSRFSTRSSS